MSVSGYVSLVGAGPGDPALLTRKALACLRQADLVLYDALVDNRVLMLARHAQRFFVGKRAGRHALAQHEIHAVMIRAAKRGRRVVRLKGGDPFIFGRGGEEALALQAAGVPFDVVPGVTSVIAAPASVGIPITHRGLASAFFVVSGHDRQVFADAIAALKPQGVTVVILMGYRRRVSLAAHMIEAGWPGSTPAAIVASGTLPERQVWRGTLGEIAGDNADATYRADAIDVRPKADATYNKNDATYNQADATDNKTDGGPKLIVVGEVASLDLRSTLERLAEMTDAPRPMRAQRSR